MCVTATPVLAQQLTYHTIVVIYDLIVNFISFQKFTEIIMTHVAMFYF